MQSVLKCIILYHTLELLPAFLSAKLGGVGGCLKSEYLLM